MPTDSWGSNGRPIVLDCNLIQRYFEIFPITFGLESMTTRSSLDKSCSVLKIVGGIISCASTMIKVVGAFRQQS